ncbi:hypothetical protein KDL29_08815 [bacterium]|nr:hypothetical protein [bacterium]
MTRNVICHVLVALILLLAGCGGGSMSPASETEMQLAPATQVTAADATDFSQGLPSPAEIDRQLSAVDDMERLMFGTNFEPLLPFRNSSGSIFTPNWGEPSDGLALAAYACYRYGFQSGSYQGDARFRLQWGFEPTDLSNVYVGLADFSMDRWQWFPCGAEGFNAGDVEPFLSGKGEIIMCVLLLGTDPAILDYALLGDNLAPHVNISTDLEADPLMNIAPRLVSIDASSSYSFGGEIVGFDFDWTGNGTWDKLADPDGQVLHEYSAGNYTLRVRVTESSGLQSVEELDFTIVPDFNPPPGAVINANLLTGSAPLTVMVDALGSSDPDGFITKYEYDIDNDGVYELQLDETDAVPVTLSNYGDNKVILRVTDNFFATDTAELTVNLDSGWSHSIVDSNVSLNDRVDMAVIGTGNESRPAVVYSSSTESELRFCQATSFSGNTWGSIRKPAGPGAQVGSRPAPAVAYMGLYDTPIISYIGKAANNKECLFIVRGNNGTSSTWQTPIQVSTDNVENDTDIIVLNNLAAVATVRYPGAQVNTEISYYQALNETATSWSTARTVRPVQPGLDYFDLSLLPYENGLFDRPMLSYVSGYNDGIHNLYTTRSTNADGTAWEAQVDHGQLLAHSTDLKTINGNPAVVAGSHVQDGQLGYLRSVDEKATGWQGSLQQVGTGGYCSLMQWDGRPCVAYYDPNSGGLMLICAENAEGSSWTDAIPVDTHSGRGEYCSSVIVNNVPVICYADKEQKRLMATYWRDN